MDFLQNPRDSVVILLSRLAIAIIWHPISMQTHLPPPDLCGS
jgi:hypothetical protein